MAVNYTPLLNLAQPVNGTEVGTWGDDVNNGVSTYLDIAVAGGLAVTVTVSDVTLAPTQGTSTGANLTALTSQYAILNVSGLMTAARNLIVPSTSKWYIVNNSTTGGFALTVKGVATTGVALANGEKAFIAWNGTDFVKVASQSGAGVFTSITAASVTDSGLTSGRVTYASTGGLLADSLNMTFNGTVLTSSFAGPVAATTLSASSTVSGTGFSTYLASPPAIGGTAPAAGTFTTLTASSNFQGRINPRVSSAASAASITPDVSAFDQYAVTAQAAALTINAPTGTPVDGNKLIFRILDNGTSQTLTWNATYTVMASALPTATVINKTLYVGCIYNAAATRWDVVAVVAQA